ncbi:MAG: sulfatase-like hydrolase/transferase [Verrucomicrobia bacterium]|nr:sulfatase-like hydrolase/transferase [Verrucomicrobiota bacterium]
MNGKRLLGLIAAVCLATLPASQCFAAQKGRPNILLIMTDQQSADAMSCRIGSRYLKTPAMDSLAAKGTTFTRAYAANPLCVPSRTAIFTGRYPHETAVQSNEPHKLDAAAFPCMGTVFKRAGYDTGYVGKWHFQFNSKDEAAHGFDYTANLKNNGGDNASPALAIEFLRKPRTQPFLLVASFVNPHNICEWARGDRLPDGAVGEPPPPDQCPPRRANHEPPKNESDIMLLMRRSFQMSRVFPVGGFDEKKWREYIWAYYRMIEMADRHIGTVLQALRDAGLERNTLVVFTSDHGDCQGAHGWNQKTVFYDESTRVPLIFCWPGVTKVGTSERLVQMGIDLLPTFCDYADIPATKSLPGLSLKATANGQTTDDPRDYIVVSNKMVQGEPIDGVKCEPEGRMLRSRRYKYSVYSLGQRRESLFDMQQDPGETINLAENPQHRATLDQHREYLTVWCQKYQDAFIRHVPKGK